MVEKKPLIYVPLVLLTSFFLVFSLFAGNSTAFVEPNIPEDTPEPIPNYIVGPDMIVSFDEESTSNDALHPATAIAPLGTPNEESIHVVWDEVSELSGGFREIMYSMSEDGGMTWNHDRDDFVISPNNKANSGNSVNPSIAIDRFGRIHVIWAEQMSADGTWEIMYSRSDNNGKDWTGLIQETMISKRLGTEGDAQTISAPKIYAAPSDKWGTVLYAVWSEYNYAYGQSVHLSKSFNGGVTWSATEQGDLAEIPGETESFNPVIAVSGIDGEQLHLTWTQIAYELEEVFYIMSPYYGNKGTWIGEARPISFTDQDGMKVNRISMTIDVRNWLHVIWSQSDTKDPSFREIFYSGSNNLGESWTGEERDIIVSRYDGHPASMPTVSSSPERIQVAWTEVDEQSPYGTTEIHTSWTEDPLNPESWTGLKDDIVVSHADEWGPANAQNATVALGTYKGDWTPTYVWNELNDEPTPLSKAPDLNNEIHTNPPEWILDISTSGSGYVTKDPNQSTYANGTSVQLTAVPYAGWSFSYWGGDISGSTNPQTITMYNDMYIIAYFSQDQYTLTVNVYGSGSVAKSPDQATYTYGQGVTLTANPAFGWRFDHWSGAISGTTNPRSITVYSSYIVNAHFYQNIFNRNLTVGWNLVSLPYIQASTSITTVLSSISGSYDVVKYYDVQDSADPWKTYRIGGTANDLANADYTSALWIHATAPCILSVYGNIPSSTAIPLYTGWNLVGYPSATSRLASVTLPPVADIVGIWSATSPYVVDYTDKTLVTMSQGNGYWVHVTADCSWSVNW